MRSFRTPSHCAALLWLALVGSLASEAAATNDGLRLRAIGTPCTSGDAGSAFVEFVATAPGQLRSAGLRFVAGGLFGAEARVR